MTRSRAILAALALLVVASLVMCPSPLSAQWTFKADLDPMTDEDRSYASVYSTDSSARLFVRCRQPQSLLESTVTGPIARFAVYVVFDDYLGDDRGDVNLRYRVDDLPVSRGLDVEVSTTGTAVFLKSHEAWAVVRKLKQHSTILFEAADFRHTSHYARFSLRGSQRAIDRLGDCVHPHSYIIPLAEYPFLTKPYYYIRFGCFEGLYVEQEGGLATQFTANGEERAIEELLRGDDARWLVGALLSGAEVTIRTRGTPYSGKAVGTLDANDEHAEPIREVVDACYRPAGDDLSID